MPIGQKVLFQKLFIYNNRIPHYAATKQLDNEQIFT